MSIKHKRHFIHYCGALSWCFEQAGQLLLTSIKAQNQGLYCGKRCEALNGYIGKSLSVHIRRSEIETILGGEYPLLIVNAYDGFNAELFCALCATIQTPGLIILLSPALREWCSYADPDYSRLCSYPYKPADIKGRFIRYFIRESNAVDGLIRFDQRKQAHPHIPAVMPIDPANSQNGWSAGSG